MTCPLPCSERQTRPAARMEDNLEATDESCTVVNKCIESLEKLVNLKASADRALYVASIERLQAVVSSEEAALKYFVSSRIGGISLLVAILEKSQDQTVRYYAILLMDKILCHKTDEIDYVQAFVQLGTVDHLLKLIVKCQFSWGEDMICSLYKVAAKIADEDKKFAVKARFLGVLPVIVSHLKAYSKKCDVLLAILKLLKKVMTSSVNATKLCKDGLTKELLHFLEDSKKVTIISVLETISEATRSRHAGRQFIKDDIIPKILQLMFNISASCSNKYSTAICKTCLRILVHLTQLKIGREKLLSANMVPSLLNWSQRLLDIPGCHYTTLVSLVSTVLQRCLAPRLLPVRKLSNPVVYTLTESFCHHESDGSEGRNDDSLSLASSNFSSAESASDSEEESRPLNFTECSFHDSIDRFSVFFQELSEASMPSHFGHTEADERTIEENCFYDAFLSSPVIELNELKPDSIANEEKNKHFGYQNLNTDVLLTENNEYFPNTERISMCHIHEQFSAEHPNIFSKASCDAVVNLPMKETSDVNRSLLTCDHFSLFGNYGKESLQQKYIDMYHKQAASTVFVTPFIKLAFPDTVKAPHIFEVEPLLKQDPFLIRKKIYKNTEEMAQNYSFYREIYSLDSLLNDNYPSPSSLTNKDEQQVYLEQQFDHLNFEARFESGNLRKVFWKGERDYDLILNPDINSKGHLQWFYFQVSGMQSNCVYTFNIINMEKSTSLFNEGMRPVMFSVKNFLEKKEGWVRAGHDIGYFRNHYIQGLSANSVFRQKSYYTMTFSAVFQNSNDICYFAYHFPYTYTTLQTQLHFLMTNMDTSSIYCKKDELCKTLSGNSVPLLTITAKPLDYQRPYIFLTARVHPGESNSSWVMKGVLEFLLSDEAQKLREMYIFKVVPMLNPDGVINGCLRCSLSGQDLNRQWIVPNAYLHPTIYHTKLLFYYLASKSRKPVVFCDFHGHSRRNNSFFFGCDPEQSWWPNDKTKQDLQSFKLLPMLLDKVAPIFSIEDCKFTVERSRESTGRITVWRQFDVQLSYTLECSYGGCSQGKYAGCHIGIEHLEDMGIKLCQSFVQLMFDSQCNSVRTSVPINLEEFKWSISKKISRSKYASSTETDDDFENCEEIDHTL